MTATPPQFLGSIPGFYDRGLGPFLFEPYASDLARRVVAVRAARVLELACGTGIATRRIREALPGSAHLVATDLSPAMIDFARAKLIGDDIHWRTADATALPFKDRSFDTVVCQFGVMFFPDRARGLREARRVLRPGGTFLASVWCPLEDNPAAEAVHRAAAAMFPDDPPPFLRVPYGSVDADALRRLAVDAGFESITVSRVDLEGVAASTRDVAIGFAKGSPLALELSERGADLDAAAAAFEAALAGDGAKPFRSPLGALVLTAS